MTGSWCICAYTQPGNFHYYEKWEMMDDRIGDQENKGEISERKYYLCN